MMIDEFDILTEDKIASEEIQPGSNLIEIAEDVAASEVVEVEVEVVGGPFSLLKWRCLGCGMPISRSRLRRVTTCPYCGARNELR